MYFFLKSHSWIFSNSNAVIVFINEPMEAEMTVVTEANFVHKIGVSFLLLNDPVSKFLCSAWSDGKSL